MPNEKLYDTIEVRGPTSHELRSSKLPDTNLVAMIIYLKDKQDRDYHFTHVSRRKDKEDLVEIKINAGIVDLLDYRTVITYIASDIIDMIERESKDIFENRNKFIENVIGYSTLKDLENREFRNMNGTFAFTMGFTQSKMANLIEIYHKYFKDLKISLYFTELSKNICDNSGLPLEKLLYS